MSVNRTPNTRAGGIRRFLEDWLNLVATTPVWWAGMPLQRDDGALGQVERKQAFGYAAIRTGIRAISFEPTYPYMAYGEFPTTFTTAPDSSPFVTVVGVIIGTMAIPHKSDHATAYKAGEHQKCVTENQTVEGEASTPVPCAMPISEDAGGEGWLGGGGGTLGDTGNMTGSIFRAYQGVMADYLGVAYADVAANVGAYFNTDITVLLTTPPVQIESS